jgi:hypothetical protein
MGAWLTSWRINNAIGPQCLCETTWCVEGNKWHWWSSGHGLQWRGPSTVKNAPFFIQVTTPPCIWVYMWAPSVERSIPMQNNHKVGSQWAFVNSPSDAILLKLHKKNSNWYFMVVDICDGPYHYGPPKHSGSILVNMVYVIQYVRTWRFVFGRN